MSHDVGESRRIWYVYRDESGAQAEPHSVTLIVRSPDGTSTLEPDVDPAESTDVEASDEDAWEAWAREAVEAEAYSRRLGRKVSEGYEAKFRRHRDPGGNAPLGFRRVNGLLEVDPDTVGRAIEVFERYATGLVSLVELEAETDIDHEALKVMLRNPVYNGWVRRHRRQPDEQLQPAAWRHDPPVSDELWARVQEVRARRYKGGGYPTPRHVHLLAGRLYCVCGGRIGSTTDAAHGKLRRRYRHDGRCVYWGGASIRQAAVFDLPISAQVEQMRLGPRSSRSCANWPRRRPAGRIAPRSGSASWSASSRS